jgi:hypothetical protein
MRPNAKPESKLTGLEDINYRISNFINTFTTVLFVAEIMAVVGVLMKFMQVNGGSYVFIFSIIVLTLIFLVQIGLSFFFIVSHVRLALLGAFGSLALALSFMAIMFRYQGWWGWQLMFFIAIPIFLVTAFFLGKYFSKHEKLHHNQLRFLYRNLLIPYILAFVLGIMAFLLDRNTLFPEHHWAVETSQPADTLKSW